MNKANIFDRMAEVLNKRKELRLLKRNKKITDELLRNDWTVIKTMTAKWTNDYGEVVNTITFVLLENGLGERKSRHATTAYVSKYTPDDSLHHGIYTKIIFPWTNGAKFSDIPTYLDLKKAGTV